MKLFLSFKVISISLSGVTVRTYVPCSHLTSKEITWYIKTNHLYFLGMGDISTKILILILDVLNFCDMFWPLRTYPLTEHYATFKSVENLLNWLD